MERTAALMTGTLGFRAVRTDGDWTRYALGDGGSGTFADVRAAPSFVPGQIAVGSIHHVAWRTPDDAQQERWLHQISDLGLGVSPVMDRDYFHSIYFREPGGILFEIATDSPGFATDETLETLGAHLRLPIQYEADRPQIEAGLPPIRVPGRE